MRAAANQQEGGNQGNGHCPIHCTRLPVHETITGFKWMGNLSHTFLEKGSEELVLDKDEVSGATVTGEMATYLYSNGQTFSSLLKDI
uniref:Uncharacterized protein n=1 Tax=Amphimedon queenslandica TaxID=400682 RepID=A0A1X7U7E7_AMPQE